MDDNPYVAPQTSEPQDNHRNRIPRTGYDPLELQRKVSRRFWSIVFLLYLTAALATIILSLR
jgi:hypothetical protein